MAVRPYAAAISACSPSRPALPRPAQVKLFSDRDHVRALHTGDVWAAVGSSHDLALVGRGAEARRPAARREWQGR
jgi:hypothetical protein